MSKISPILICFTNWVSDFVVENFFDVQYGIEQKATGDLAWLTLIENRTISKIEIWRNGEYYCEILTENANEPDITLFGQLRPARDFSVEFSKFFNRIHELEGPVIMRLVNREENTLMQSDTYEALLSRIGALSSRVDQIAELEANAAIVGGGRC